MKKINIQTSSKRYPVYLGKDIFKNLLSLIKNHKLNKNIFIIIDERIQSIYSEKVNAFISQTDSKLYSYSINAGEEKKSLQTANDLFTALLTNEFGRDSLIVAIGGGITGDIAGFVASTFVRGVQLVHIPTTLLAMVDSSIGGKTGVNFHSTKNIIGSFYQPEFVLADIDFISTLSEEEIICGLGEVLKYSFLIGDDFRRYIQKNINTIISLNPKQLNYVIENCIHFKAEIVEKDEREESGLRKILNLGHTFAHAIEIEQKHQVKHGQAVIMGLACAFHLSNKLNLLDDYSLAEYLSLLLSVADKIKIGRPDFHKIWELMKRDKKSADDKINFVLVKKSGNILLDVQAAKEDVIYSLQNGLQYFLI